MTTRYNIILQLKRRFFRAEKRRFIEEIKSILNKFGYETNYLIHKSLLKSENLETTNDECYEYLLIAHYDTGTRMPFWMMWFMKIFGLNRQLLILGIIFILSFLTSFLLGNYIVYLVILLFLSLIPIAIPNKVNYDDNTSGIISVLEIARKLELKGKKEKIKILIVDNEELGLWGSAAAYKMLNKSQDNLTNKKIINLDCVGQGNIPVIVSNSTSPYKNILLKHLSSKFKNVKDINMILPASDNFSFRKYGALSVLMTENSSFKDGYYIKNIHSINDNLIDFERIDNLTDCIVEMITSDK